jgi:hypothetical protein
MLWVLLKLARMGLRTTMTARSLIRLVSNYLSEHHLFPPDQHRVYSLRHSFQDRLLAVHTPDLIQADLMGHKFRRPMFRDGEFWRISLNG